MMHRVIKCRQAINDKEVLIWIEHIGSMTQNDAGGAVIHVGGETYGLIETPPQVMELIDKLLREE